MNLGRVATAHVVGDGQAAAPGGGDHMAVQGAKEMLGGQSEWASADCIECHRYHWARPQTANKLPELPAAEGVP